MRSFRTCSADCRASSMMRPASLRASASWAWYSSSTSWASALAPSAASRSLRRRSSRAVRDSLMAGNAFHCRTAYSAKKAMEPQMISLVAGRIGLNFSAARTTGPARTCMSGLLGELDEDEDHEPDEGEGLGEGDT